jgi:hypothetical protein
VWRNKRRKSAVASRRSVFARRARRDTSMLD